MSHEILATNLSVSVRTIERWTRDERLVIEEEREKAIIDRYLQCPTTQQEIASSLDIDQSTVSRVIKTMQERQVSELHTGFIPLSSTLWPSGLPEAGPLPQPLVENLLHFHTVPFDVVFDPFSEATNTRNACIRMMRRYYCCDPLGLSDIKQWDLSDGLPPDLPTPNLAIIDLAGLGIEEVWTWNGTFLALQRMTNELIKKNTSRIAIHLNPTRNQDGTLDEPLLELGSLMSETYSVEGRYVIQYQGSDSPEAIGRGISTRHRKPCRIDHSDLVVWVK